MVYSEVSESGRYPGSKNRGRSAKMFPVTYLKVDRKSADVDWRQVCEELL